ncbi:hypothetical protein FRC06_008987 [Ceratobasidium sp. 370]|nr:hypothetical protein FRC06_008987 [Ceratobasidium sp. 370]
MSFVMEPGEDMFEGEDSDDRDGEEEEYEGQGNDTMDVDYEDDEMMDRRQYQLVQIVVGMGERAFLFCLLVMCQRGRSGQWWLSFSTTPFFTLQAGGSSGRFTINLGFFSYTTGLWGHTIDTQSF